MRRITIAVVLLGVLAFVAPAGSAGEEEQKAEPEVLTMAKEYGLRRDQVASFDAHLCDRLIRFGKVAMYRGHYTEAKRFFWKAILVDPTSVLAWEFYDQAVLFTVAKQVERFPGLVGLPGLSEQPDKAPEPAAEELEEGC